MVFVLCTVSDDAVYVSVISKRELGTCVLRNNLFHYGKSPWQTNFIYNRSKYYSATVVPLCRNGGQTMSVCYLILGFIFAAKSRHKSSLGGVV